MDTNWRVEEALLTVRNGVYLTPEQEARMQLELATSGERRDLRRAIAAALLSVAEWLDPGSSAALPEQAQGRPA